MSSRELLERLSLVVMVACGASACCIGQSFPIASNYGTSREEIEAMWMDLDIPFRNGDVKGWKYDSNGYHVELGGFLRQSAARQEKPEWCWAACIQMVASRNEQRLSQEEIVRALRNGRATNEPGSVMDIARSLMRNGSSIHLGCADGNMILDSLALDSPIILNLKPERGSDVGHAVVAYGMEFSFGYQREVIVHEVLLVDPRGGRSLRRSGASLTKAVGSAVYFIDANRD